MHSLLSIIVFTTIFLEASEDNYESLSEFFRFTSVEDVCNKFNRWLHKTDITSKDLNLWSRLVWDEVTTNDIFKNMTQSAKFQNRSDYIKFEYLKYINNKYILLKKGYSSLTSSDKKFIKNLIHITLDTYKTYVSCDKDLHDNDLSFEKNFKNKLKNNICFGINEGNELPIVIMKKCESIEPLYETCLDINSSEGNFGLKVFLHDIKVNQNHVWNANCTNQVYDYKDVYIPNVNNLAELCNSENGTYNKITNVIAKLCKQLNILKLCDSENMNEECINSYQYSPDTFGYAEIFKIFFGILFILYIIVILKPKR
ncbi:putative SP-containing membrane protein [Vairimorpha necatrix]|uniref:SP-containing membrane protein n=1 Tax=Vairimorpha necatrix TaxID=6039 RepID=A0AAX4JDQ3_9MICR